MEAIKPKRISKLQLLKSLTPTPISKPLKIQIPKNPINMMVEQKTALLKRNKNPKRLTIEQFSINFINKELMEAEEEIRESNGLDALEKTDINKVKGYIFSARVRVIESHIKKGDVPHKLLKVKWCKEYEYIENNKFPYSWMKKQKNLCKMLIGVDD